MGNIEANADVPKPDLQVVTPTVQLNAQPPRADAGISLGYGNYAFGGGASAGVDVNAPNAGVGVGVDVNAPRVDLEASGPEVNVGAKVGEFFEGVGAGIGGLFSAGAKAPKAEVNVEAPSIDVAARVPPVVAPRVHADMPNAELNLGLNAGAGAGLSGGVGGGVQVDAHPPSVDIKGPKVDAGGSGFLSGLFGGGAKVSDPKAELNVAAPTVEVNAPKLQAGLDVNAPKAELQVGVPSLEVSGKVKAPKMHTPKVVQSFKLHSTVHNG